jgi:hypothetical protein
MTKTLIAQRRLAEQLGEGVQLNLDYPAISTLLAVHPCNQLLTHHTLYPDVSALD